MRNKKTRFATALLATALLSNGFTLESKEEVITAEPEPSAEVIAEKESTPVIKPQQLVADEEIQVKILEEEPTIKNEKTLPFVPTETEPPPTPEPQEPQQATALPQTQADTTQPVPEAEQPSATREPTINIPEPPLDKEPVKRAEPEPSPEPTPEPVAKPAPEPEPSPEPTPVPEESTSAEGEGTYVEGFGWVPYSGPNEVIYAADMFENGNKVGTMGGG